MIVHFCASSSDSTHRLYSGKPIAYWYRKLFSEVNWGQIASELSDETVFIWNPAFLSRLDLFSAWLKDSNAETVLKEGWHLDSKQLCVATCGTNLMPYLLSNDLDFDTLCANTNPSPFPAEIDTLKALYDPMDIQREIHAFQYIYYSNRGVIFNDPTNFYIDGLAEIGQGSRIHSGAIIEGETKVSENVVIGPNVHLVNACIGSGATILAGSLIYDSTIEAETQIGPYAHLRAGAVIGQGAKIGNFVEVKKSQVGKKSKAMHLSYLGDASIGTGVNIGAGTITCNYDGTQKHPTTIEDNVFVGSGTELVAPIILEKNSYIAAGSTITETVPSESLAIARMKQRIIPNWFQRKSRQTKD